VRQVKDNRTRLVMTCAFWLLSVLDRMPCVARPIISSGASGHGVDDALTNSRPLEIDVRYLNRDAWQASVRLDCSDRALGLCPVDLTGASGRYTEYPFVFITTLSFEGAYKYVLAGLGRALLDILTS
jgi:hypothetical protein